MELDAQSLWKIIQLVVKLEQAEHTSREWDIQIIDLILLLQVL